MMKKMIVCVASLLALQGIAYAAASTYSGGALSLASGIKFTPSNNVKVFYFSDTQNYTINSKHTAGDRQYSTSNRTSNIWYHTATAGTDITAGSTPVTTTGADNATEYTSSNAWTAQ